MVIEARSYSLIMEIEIIINFTGMTSLEYILKGRSLYINIQEDPSVILNRNKCNFYLHQMDGILLYQNIYIPFISLLRGIQ